MRTCVRSTAAALDRGCPPIDVERELAGTDAVIAEFRKE